MSDTRWALLYDRYSALIADTPRLRARDAAGRLGVSEAELVAAKATAGISRPLRRDPERGFAPLLEGIPGVG